MKQKITKLALAATTVLTVATPVLAQTPAGGSASTDIIVTARRVEERLQDVPIAITVFNQSQLEAHNVVSAEDLARTTPSLQVSNEFGSENTMFSLRGFTQDISSAPTVGTYFGDVVAPRGGSFSTPAGDGAGPGSFFDLQNVQVLKGPQGTLQGRNTTGGAVMLVPKKPTDKLEGYVEGTLGNYSAIGIQGVINIPVNDTFRVRLGIDRQKRDGYVINGSGIGPRDFGNINYTALRASVVADLTPNLENYMIASYSNSNNHGSVQKLGSASVGNSGEFEGFALDQLQRQAAGGFYGVLADMPISQNRTRQWQIINTTTWQATDNLTVKNIISYAEYRQQFRQPMFGTNFQVNNPNGLANLLAFLRNNAVRNGTPDPSTFTNGNLLATLQGLAATPGLGFNYAQINPYPGTDNSAESTFVEEFRLQGHGLDGKLDWQGGFYFEKASPLGPSGAQTTVASQCTGITTLAPSCISALAIAANAYNNNLGLNGGTPNPGLILNGGYNPSTYTNALQDTALYAQATYKLTDRVSLTGGFRYTWDKQSTTDNPQFVGFVPNPTGLPIATTYCINYAVPQTSAPGGTCYATNSNKSSAPTWLIDLDWKPIDNVLLYAKYARGYRAGGVKPDVTQLISGPLPLPGFPPPPPAATYTIDSWKPEKLDSYEVGLKTSFHGVISGIFNVSAFYNKFSNQQIQLGISALTSPSPGESSIYNAGKSRIYGLEADTSLNLFKGFVLNAAYTYLNSKVTALNLPIGAYSDGGTPTFFAPLVYALPLAVVGKPLTYTPKNKFTINGNYTIPFDPKIGEISVGVTFTHTDSQYSTFSDTGLASQTLQNGVFVQSTADQGLLQATNILDLNASWNGVLGSPLDMSFFMTNVTKQHYYTGATGTLALGFEIYTLGAPQIWGFRAKVHF